MCLAFDTHSRIIQARGSDLQGIQSTSMPHCPVGNFRVKPRPGPPLAVRQNGGGVVAGKAVQTREGGCAKKSSTASTYREPTKSLHHRQLQCRSCGPGKSLGSPTTTAVRFVLTEAGVPTQAYNGMERGCLQKIFVFLFSSCLLARGQLPDYPMTIREMETEAGYFTEGGKYLGGIPSPDSVRHRIYECENYYHAGNDTSNGTVCVEWRVDKSAGATTPLGSCECTFVTNEGYCSAWVCHGVKRETECTSTNCYVTTNSNNVYCTCDVENSSGLFCNAWSCKKTTSSSDGWAEHQEYDCLGASSSGHYCDAWNGNLTASRKITVVACRCVSEWNGELVCAYWECEKMSMTKCARHDGWCNLEVSVGVGGVVGFVGVLVICVSICTGRTFLRSACGVLFGILWCAIWAIGVVIWGGVDGATYVGIMWGVPILLASISRLAGIDWWSIRRGCNRVCKRWR